VARLGRERPVGYNFLPIKIKVRSCRHRFARLAHFVRSSTGVPLATLVARVASLPSLEGITHDVLTRGQPLISTL
jgi:hypothetical protein